MKPEPAQNIYATYINLPWRSPVMVIGWEAPARQQSEKEEYTVEIIEGGRNVNNPFTRLRDWIDSLLRL